MSAQRDRYPRLPPPGIPTEVVHGSPGRAAVTQCAGCGAVAETANMAGWVVARPANGRTRPYRYGACPACVDTRYTFPATREGGHRSDGFRQTDGPPGPRRTVITDLLGLETPATARVAG